MRLLRLVIPFSIIGLCADESLWTENALIHLGVRLSLGPVSSSYYKCLSIDGLLAHKTTSKKTRRATTSGYCVLDWSIAFSMSSLISYSMKHVLSKLNSLGEAPLLRSSHAAVEFHDAGPPCEFT